MHIKSSLSSLQARCGLSREILLVFLLGFVIRLFACQYTYVINPDGVLYIHEARVMYYGEPEKLGTCGAGSSMLYTALIAGAYAVFQDWVVAAKAVSCLFGSAMLIPLYFVFKNFFDNRISVLGTLIFALIPVFVGRSADVVRGPVCWFFMASGLFFYVDQIGKRHHHKLLLGSLCFLIATWVRVEAIVFVIASALYAVAIEKERRIEKAAFFFVPVVFVVLLAMFGETIFGGSIDMLGRARGIMGAMSESLQHYNDLRRSLLSIASQSGGVVKYFLPEARTCIWLVALGIFLNRCLEAFFYPFFVVFVIGFAGILEKIKADRRVLYFVLLGILSTLLLYLNTMRWWILHYRYLAILILPCSIFVGFGLQKIIRFLRSRFHLKESAVLSILCLLIMVSALPKNLKARRTDKVAFRQIGELIRTREGNVREIAIAASGYMHRWIAFYVNLDYEGASCPVHYYGHWDKLASDKVRLIEKLNQEEVKYLLWVEKHWQTEQSVLLENAELKELGRWTHPDTGDMILFEVI